MWSVYYGTIQDIIEICVPYLQWRNAKKGLKRCGLFTIEKCRIGLKCIWSVYNIEIQDRLEMCMFCLQFKNTSRLEICVVCLQ